MNVIINKKTNEVRTPGYSWGYGRGPHLKLKLRKNGYLLLHKKGTKDFGGIASPPDYYPARLIVTKIIKEEEEETNLCFRVDIIKEIETGYNWREAEKQAMEIINECKTT